MSPPAEGAGGAARLFVGLELARAARETLAAWAAEVTLGVEGLRLLSPESLHLTLCFLGKTGVAEVPALAESVAEVVAAGRIGAAQRAGVAERIGAGQGAGAVEWAGAARRIAFVPDRALVLPRRRPRVLALGLNDAGGRGAALQASLAARLQAGGWYVPEDRPWLAHITVARVGRTGDSRGLAEALGRGLEHHPLPVVDALTPTAVALLRSWPGSRYEPLARAVL